MVGECTTHTVRWEDESGNAGACPWCKLRDTELARDAAVAGLKALESRLDFSEKAFSAARETAHSMEHERDKALSELDRVEHERDVALGRLDAIRDHAEQMLVNVHAPESSAEKVVEWMERDVAELQRLCVVERRDPFDEAIERDAKAGKLDGLIAEAKERLG